MVTSNSSLDVEAKSIECAGAVFTGSWRFIAVALIIVGRVGLLWMAGMWVFSENRPTNPLQQMRLFAALYLAPEAAAWCLWQAFAATIRLESNRLVLHQRDRRSEIRLEAITGWEFWRIPLPSTGISLHVQGPEPAKVEIAAVDSTDLVEALAIGGATIDNFQDTNDRRFAWAHARRHAMAPLLDHPAVKFGLFSLVPTLPAFRLHQYITFGGTFGEYLTFGLWAYLTAFAIWWISWSIALVLVAASLRLVTEVAVLCLLAIRPERAVQSRRIAEITARSVFYVGVPVWLMIRLWPW